MEKRDCPAVRKKHDIAQGENPLFPATLPPAAVDRTELGCTWNVSGQVLSAGGFPLKNRQSDQFVFQFCDTAR